MGDATMTFALQPSASSLGEVRRQIDRLVGPYLPQMDLHDLKLAATEACANAILHSGTRKITVSVTRSGGCVEVVVEDDGVYQMHLSAARADPEAHRGLALMAAMVDDFSLRRGTDTRAGTVVTLRKCPS